MRKAYKRFHRWWRFTRRTVVLVFVEYDVTYRIHYRVYGLCMQRLTSTSIVQAGEEEARREEGWMDRRTNERTDGRASDYIDCVAGWQRQWHMSPKLLVIADLNMRQRGPCPLAQCAALTASYSSARIFSALLLLLPSMHFFFSFFFLIRYFFCFRFIYPFILRYY